MGSSGLSRSGYLPNGSAIESNRRARLYRRKTNDATVNGGCGGSYATPRPSGPPGPRELDEEARMTVSWPVVCWVRQAVIWVGLVVLAFLGLEVALFLLAAAYLY